MHTYLVARTKQLHRTSQHTPPSSVLLTQTHQFAHSTTHTSTCTPPHTPHTSTCTLPHTPPQHVLLHTSHKLTSVNTHITITRGGNGPLHAGAPGNADLVMWKPCFACVRVVWCFGDCGTVSLLHASAVGCANSGSTVGLCSDLPFVVQVSIFLHAVVGLQASPRFSAVGALSPSWQIRCAQHGGYKRRVKWLRRRPQQHPRMRV